jgi:hypothetical protein
MSLMDSAVARDIALMIHVGQRNRWGEPIADHLARVAATVPADARATAWLHDALERTSISAEELRAAGVTDTELEALELLSQAPSESYELYALRIAFADGEAGRLARAVKLADLDDHLAHPTVPSDAPPYRWARRRITSAYYRRDSRSRPTLVTNSETTVTR